MRVKKPINVTCLDCGLVFTAYSSHAQRCPECRKERNKRKAIERNAQAFKNVKKKPKRAIIRPKMTMQEVLRDLEIYNKANGTHLSYGQFVMILEKGA